MTALLCPRNVFVRHEFFFFLDRERERRRVRASHSFLSTLYHGKMWSVIVCTCIRLDRHLFMILVYHDRCDSTLVLLLTPTWIKISPCTIPRLTMYWFYIYLQCANKIIQVHTNLFSSLFSSFSWVIETSSNL